MMADMKEPISLGMEIYDAIEATDAIKKKMRAGLKKHAAAVRVSRYVRERTAEVTRRVP